MTTTNTASAATSLFTFYDIESLSNVFTMCAYTRPHDGLPGNVEIFYLLDDDAIDAQVDPFAVRDRVLAENPSLPRSSFAFHNLRTPDGNLRLAKLLGLSDADQVCHISEKSSYPADLRPVCDTDDDYDPRVHPFLVGYNSANYDTTMLAQYLAEVFADVAEYNDELARTRRDVDRARGKGNHADALARLMKLQAAAPAFTPITARSMRTRNDALFSEDNIDYMPRALGWDSPAAKIRMSMLRSGRHIDAARLNELQQRVALKRQLGMLGRQIKESEKLTHDSVITSIEEFNELIAYNVSDCLGLAQLFEEPIYANAFDLKAGLLAQYSETIYAKNGTVRRDRLAIDSSSAKFVGRILSPYGKLQDIEVVSFLYPHAEVARERGIPQVNVLDECVRFFEDQVVPNRATNPAEAAAYDQFMEVVAYYREIEGQNFNDSDDYARIFDLPARRLTDIPKRPNNVPYFLPGGQASTCFATFSYGGIHGAEIDEWAYRQDADTYQKQIEMIALAREIYPEATDFVAEAKRQHDTVELPDGTTISLQVVLTAQNPEAKTFGYRKPNSDAERGRQLAAAQRFYPDPAELIALRRPKGEELDVVVTTPELGVVTIPGRLVLDKTTVTGATYREKPSQKPAELFVAKDAEGRRGPVDLSTSLKEKYNHVSAGRVIHEDFTSYYPNLLRNMRAFWNPQLGEDRYASIFFDKERYGREMKAPGISPEEKTRLGLLRNGTKLILNSASGAGDAGHDTPIRMNNQIISMRIIGQLLSWRIGQAQTLFGARIISTNTDGLYSILEEELNNRVLAEQSEAIGVEIEPEPMFLISKDSNNRLELLPEDINGDPLPENTPVTEWKIATAGGGTLACFNGPRMDKSLAHPAVIDFALAHYLQATAARGEEYLREAYDPELGRKFVLEALDMDNPVRTLTFFQNVVAASRGSITYPFAADPIGDDQEVVIINPRPLQNINRTFIVRAGTPGAISLHNARAAKISPASKKKRAENGLPAVANDPIAIDILRHHGWAADRMTASTQGLALVPPGHDVVTRKINSIDPRWSLQIVNDDLHALSRERVQALLASLDIDVYVEMLGKTFENSWRNPS